MRFWRILGVALLWLGVSAIERLAGQDAEPARVIGRGPGPQERRWIDGLAAGCNDDSIEVRRAIVQLAASRSDEYWSVWIDLPEARVRESLESNQTKQVLEGLSRIAAFASRRWREGALLDWLKDPNWQVCWVAIRACEQASESKNSKPWAELDDLLKERLKHQNAAIRLAAARALAARNLPIPLAQLAGEPEPIATGALDALRMRSGLARDADLVLAALLESSPAVTGILQVLAGMRELAPRTHPFLLAKVPQARANKDIASALAQICGANLELRAAVAKLAETTGPSRNGAISVLGREGTVSDRLIDSIAEDLESGVAERQAKALEDVTQLGRAGWRLAAKTRKLLASPDPLVRRSAIRALEELGPEGGAAASQLAEIALETADPAAAELAARALASLSAYSTGAEQLLVSLLRRGEPVVRRNALQASRTAGRWSLERSLMVAQLLGDPSDSLSRAAGERLLEINASDQVGLFREGFVGLIVDRLSDRRVQVRRRAARILERFARDFWQRELVVALTPGWPKLAAALQDPDREVRAAVLETVGRMGRLGAELRWQIAFCLLDPDLSTAAHSALLNLELDRAFGRQLLQFLYVYECELDAAIEVLDRWEVDASDREAFKPLIADWRARLPLERRAAFRAKAYLWFGGSPDP